MSIIMNLYYTGKEGAARKYVEEMIISGTVDLIRNEEGNERYDFFQSLEDENTILLIDAWKDQDSLDKHHKSPMMESIIQLREKYDLHMKAEKYISDNILNEEFIRK